MLCREPNLHGDLYMKRILLTLALLATTPLLTGCEISKSFSIHKDRPCGCHGLRHHDHCSHRPKHRPPRTGSHDPHLPDHPDHPDRGYDLFANRVASSSIGRVDHGSIANRPMSARPKTTQRPTQKSSRTRAVRNAPSNHALRADSRRTKPNMNKQSKATKKRGP